jgi:putative hydrolase of the HAD superfamily
MDLLDESLCFRHDICWSVSMVDARNSRVASPGSIRAVALDYGEVLCHRPSPEALAEMAGIFGINEDKFLPIYRSSRNPYDRGDLSPRDYWAEFAGRAGVTIHPHQIESLRRLDMQMWSNVNQEMTEWLASIHSRGIKTAILSNMQTDMAAHVRKNFAWLRHFDHQIFSCEVRAIKPDPVIYRHSLALLKIAPSEVLFIDDRDENIQAARAAGIRGIVFESVEHLRKNLQALGFPVLPAPGTDGHSGIDR